jgi:hypothetical protein
VKLKVSPGGVPPGNYTTTFAGLENVTSEKYGEGLRWKFKVAQGMHAGQMASRITGLTPSPRNACGKMLSGLLGRQLNPDEEVEVGQFIDQVFMAVVAAAENGTRVEAIIAVPKA